MIRQVVRLLMGIQFFFFFFEKREKIAAVQLGSMGCYVLQLLLLSKSFLKVKGSINNFKSISI